MTPRKIEICRFLKDEKQHRLHTMLTDDIIAISIIHPKANENSFPIFLNTSKNYDINFIIDDGGTLPTRLAYADSDDRASDDPVAFPSAALAAAKAGVHSMGMSFSEVDELVKCIVPQEHYKYAMLFAQSATSHPAPLLDFFKRSVASSLSFQAVEQPPAPMLGSEPPSLETQAAGLPSPLDVAERVRSRTAYPVNSAHSAAPLDHPPAP